MLCFTSGKVEGEARAAGWAARLDQACSTVVHLDVQVLQVRQVGGEQPLDDSRIDLAYIAQAGDDATQEQDAQVRLVAAHARILQRLDLVQGGSEAHGSPPVQVSMRVHIAARKSKFKLCLQHVAAPLRFADLS